MLPNCLNTALRNGAAQHALWVGVLGLEAGGKGGRADVQGGETTGSLVAELAKWLQSWGRGA